MGILFLINAGRREAGPPGEILEQVESILEKSGREFRLQVCHSIEESRKCLESVRASTCEELWIGGGDGTLCQVLNDTIDNGAAYGIVPMGTVNALARALGIPTDPVEAVRYLLNARPVSMDIGRVDGRYFFSYATVGIHARLFHNIDEPLKKRWGRVAFWVSGVKTIWTRGTLPRFHLAIRKPGDNGISPPVHDRGYSLMVSNLRNFAGFDVVTKDRPASPGYFELHYFRHNTLWSLVRWFAKLRFLGRMGSDPDYGQVMTPAVQCRLASRRALSLQIDGEPVYPSDRRNLEFECLEGKVRVLLQETEAQRLV